MPEPVFAILGAILLVGGYATGAQVVAYSGYENGSMQRYLGTMKRLGWLEKNSGVWFITERGKIVHAVETGRRTKARGGSVRYRAQPSNEFDSLHAQWSKRVVSA
jgi:hypothetical protein